MLGEIINRVFRRRRQNGTAWRLAAWSAGIFVVFAGILFVFAIAYIQSLDVSSLAIPIAQPTIITDRNDEKIYTFAAKKSDPVPISAMPKNLLEAIVAVEDKRFYEHPGVDVGSIVRALFRDVQSGGFAEGGSTITQQLAKNVFLSPDKSVKRKIKEAAYALKIDMTYDKQEILQRYLNTIYFGEGAWGVEAASRTYFGKDVKDLTLDEAAMLAGLPKAPSRFSPVGNPKGALERRNLVLSLMVEQGMIDQKTLEASLKQPVVLRKSEDSGNNGQYASYVDAVVQEAAADYGLSEKQLASGGWVIKTEMDRQTQEAAFDVYADQSQFPESQNGQLLQSGSVFLDQRTGGIRALIGSRDTGTYRGFNRATQLKRQPGSSFKPIAVYGPALEQGYTPNSRLYDGPLDIDGYSPRNWDGQYHGTVTMTEALEQSWNIPAVWLLEQLGIDKGLDFAKRLGILLTSRDRQLGTALGGLSEGVSPLQMAQAFSAFANNGSLNEAHTIRSIENSEGYTVFKFDSQPKQAMSPNTAYTMTLLLQNAVENGTGRLAAVPGRPTAGKTGTTDLPETPEFAGIQKGAKDLWFVGYTPELTGAVWIGYDKTDREHVLTASSGAAAAVFREIMSRALAGVPPSSFNMPEGYRPNWGESDYRQPAPKAHGKSKENPHHKGHKNGDHAKHGKDRKK